MVEEAGAGCTRDAELAVVVAATHEIWMRTNARIVQALARHRMTAATFQALWAIDPDAPPPSMKAMTARLYCNAPNTTFIAGQLEERGWIERAVDPADRRSRVLVLTEQGRLVREDVVRAALDSTPFAHLPDEDVHRLVGLVAPAAGLDA